MTQEDIRQVSSSSLTGSLSSPALIEEEPINSQTPPYTPLNKEERITHSSPLSDPTSPGSLLSSPSPSEHESAHIFAPSCTSCVPLGSIEEYRSRFATTPIRLETPCPGARYGLDEYEFELDERDEREVKGYLMDERTWEAERAKMSIGEIRLRDMSGMRI